MATPIPRSYDRAQRTLHWLMAALILAAIPLGLAAASLPAGASPRVAMLTAHKSLGMTVLVLAVLRLAYRAAVGAPPYAELLAPLLRAASQLAHFALYALIRPVRLARSRAVGQGARAPGRRGAFLARLDPDRGRRAASGGGRLAPLGQARRSLRAHVAWPRRARAVKAGRGRSARRRG